MGGAVSGTLPPPAPRSAPALSPGPLGTPPAPPDRPHPVCALGPSSFRRLLRIPRSGLPLLLPPPPPPPPRSSPLLSSSSSSAAAVPSVPSFPTGPLQTAPHPGCSVFRWPSLLQQFMCHPCRPLWVRVRAEILGSRGATPLAPKSLWAPAPAGTARPLPSPCSPRFLGWGVLRAAVILQPGLWHLGFLTGACELRWDPLGWGSQAPLHCCALILQKGPSGPQVKAFFRAGPVCLHF